MSPSVNVTTDASVAVSSDTSPRATSVGTSSSATGATENTTTVDPRFAVTGSLNLEPELVLPLPMGGGQVHNVQGTSDWLYFSGRISTDSYPESLPVDGTGVFRMKKEPNARPEPLLAANPSTFPYRYHWDNKQMYYLDWERVLIWQETAAGLAPTFTEVPLQGSYDLIGGDDDSVFAYTNNCVRITLVNKATRVTQVWEPENAWAAGGSWGLTSDGKTLYCTGVQESGNAVLYAIDKSTGAITQTPITHDGNENLLQLQAGFIENGSLYQIMEPYFFGRLDLTTGMFTTLSENPGAWGPYPS
jgi:hypothetical protein